MLIYCCGCAQDVTARLTDGSEIYPHRLDLADIPFWVCDTLVVTIKANSELNL